MPHSRFKKGNTHFKNFIIEQRMQVANVLYLCSTFLVIVDHLKHFYTTGFDTHIVMLVAQQQEQFVGQCLAQRHFDMLTAGSGIEPGSFTGSFTARTTPPSEPQSPLNHGREGREINEGLCGLRSTTEKITKVNCGTCPDTVATFQHITE